LATKTNLRLADTETAPATTDAHPPVVRRRERTPPGRRPVLPLGYRWYPPVKAAADTVIAALLFVVALPVVLLAALLVKLTSRGPAFYTQSRLARGGRSFKIYKLRTMIHNCESLTGPRWAMPGDPRVTAIGRFLRATHLDELPQLLNVLRGEMSLVGPRPERPEFVPELERALPAYRQRLNVKPGVTGLAQLQLPPDTDIGSVRRKLAHDLYYIRHLSLWLDLRLIVGTGLYALGVSYRVLRRLLGIPGSTQIERAMHELMPEPAARRAA
jgi:lipopolysaccharide/colanic/teichoic acid biosynthesis glycosyltransferase